MTKTAEAPILRELEDSVEIGKATFPKRDGWDFEESFSARSDGSGDRRWIFVLRSLIIENGYAGKNYKRGVVWTGKGYMDITFFVATGIWRTNDDILKSGGYESACSPMSYVEKWEQTDLNRRQ